VPAPVLTYRSCFLFDPAPERLWDQIEQFDRFESWWPCLTDLSVEGDGLVTGSVLCGKVTPPLPYRMALRIELVECRRPHAVDATIGGDLVGEARLRLQSEGGGTRAEVAWSVEMRQPAMRLASRIGRPLLQWGHDRVVETTVAGFRRRIEGL
jgi:carbon monoxide dehydrogenase subunit G